MTAEYLLASVVIAAIGGLVLVLWRSNQNARPERSLVLIGVAVPSVVALAMVWFREPISTVPAATFRPIEVRSDGYVGSDACRSCHVSHHATWHASYHRTMTQVVTRETVMPDIDHLQFEAMGLSFQLRWQDDELWAALEMPTGEPDENGNHEIIEMFRPIVMSTGSHHMQIYWFPLEEDKRLLAMFPLVYLNEEQRWIPRGAAFLQPTFALSDELGRWNKTCIACHATFGRMRPAEMLDGQSGERFLDPNQPDSVAAEFGISCEACHGPGAEHTAANRNPLRRYQRHFDHTHDATITNPTHLSHEADSQVCGQCHSVFWIDSVDAWWKDGFSYRPGHDLTASKTRSVVRVTDPPNKALQAILQQDPEFVKDHFWSDGMVRISGREYNGLIESACYEHGDMSCMSCHQLHQAESDQRPTDQWANDQLKTIATTDRVCLECHPKFQDAAELTQHTHHAAESTGSNCYNCHMSYTTYGLLKAIRSHQIEVPSVATSLSTGRPNACNQCHLDQTLGWTSRQLNEWYGTPEPELTDDEQTIAASVLWLLRGDAGQRALMAWSYGWPAARAVSGTDWLAPYLAQLLEDPYAAVRFIAAKSLKRDKRFADLDFDFLSEPETLASANSRIRAAWARLPKRTNAAVLIAPQGALMSEQFKRLLGQRNNREITLVE